MVPEAQIPPLRDDTSKPVPPLNADVVESVLPPDGEATKDDGSEPPQAFGGGPVELSLLPL